MLPRWKASKFLSKEWGKAQLRVGRHVPLSAVMTTLSDHPGVALGLDVTGQHILFGKRSGPWLTCGPSLRLSQVT